MQVLSTGDRLTVSADLLDSESVDKLIMVLEANKALLPSRLEMDRENLAEADIDLSAELGEDHFIPTRRSESE